MRKALPTQLDFLLQPASDSREPISAPWLLSPFPDPIWECQFGEVERTIDFRVVLNDGSLLTASKNHGLLLGFKRFLCLQTSPLLVGGRPIGHRAQGERVTRATHIIDYWLLNAEGLGLAVNGLNDFDANEVRLLCIELARGKRIQRSLYDPGRIISEYLRLRVRCDKRQLFDEAKVLALRRAAIDERPVVVPLLEPEGLPSRTLSLTLQELNSARRLLYCDGLYKWLKGTRNYELDVYGLTKAAYRRRTLNSNPKFDGLEFPELAWGAAEAARIEFPRAPVHTNADDPRAGDQYYQAYLSTLKSLNWFTRSTTPLVSQEALDAADNLANMAPAKFKEKGRFKLIPFEVTQTLLRRSMDFMYDYGESIVDCALEVATTADTTKIHQFQQLRALNVVDWSMSQKPATTGYFQALREAPGLYEVFCILLGAIDVCVETVVSRRSKELVDLRRNCIGIVPSGEYVLHHDAGKRGLGSINEQAQKPIPPLAAHALGLLERLHRGANAAGVDLGKQLLVRPSARHPDALCRPRSPWFIRVLRVDLMECVDLMCDYFESPCDAEGRRYYVRNHQLRRSFAFQFIWCGFFGGVDVLGWFLGHGSKRATSRYFTELLKGDAIVLKATIAAKAVRAGLPAAQELAEFIAAKHGVKIEALSILDDETVDDWMEGAMADGSLDITVEFFDGAGSENYRSLIVVKGKG